MANELATLIHGPFTLSDNQTLLTHHITIDINDIGLWIDPIGLCSSTSLHHSVSNENIGIWFTSQGAVSSELYYRTCTFPCSSGTLAFLIHVHVCVPFLIRFNKSVYTRREFRSIAWDLQQWFTFGDCSDWCVSQVYWFTHCWCY